MRFALGDQAAAARLVSRACEIHRALQPGSLEHGSCILSLGDVWWDAGKRSRAIELWRQGLDMIERLRMRLE